MQNNFTTVRINQINKLIDEATTIGLYVYVECPITGVKSANIQLSGSSNITKSIQTQKNNPNQPPTTKSKLLGEAFKHFYHYVSDPYNPTQNEFDIPCTFGYPIEAVRSSVGSWLCTYLGNGKHRTQMLKSNNGCDILRVTVKPKDYVSKNSLIVEKKEKVKLADGAKVDANLQSLFQF